jgi:hypothetical protein
VKLRLRDAAGQFSRVLYGYHVVPLGAKNLHWTPICR